MPAAIKTPYPGSSHANAPQRNGKPVSTVIASKYSANTALTVSPYLFYSTPAASVRTNQHFKAMLSSTAGKPDSPSAHTPPPKDPA